mgnify:CR=1 FL=1
MGFGSTLLGLRLWRSLGGDLYRIRRPNPMFQDSTQGAGASNIPPENNTLPEYDYENVNHTLFGSLTAILNTIKLLHKLNYAEPNDWSRPLPTGRSNEMMAILTRRVRVD